MTTADKAFGVIAIHKKLITKPELKNAEAELASIHAQGAYLSLEQFFRDRSRFTEDEFRRIVTTRARHGRSCSDCGGLTFLLPGQRSNTITCEHCGGALIQGRIDRPTQRRAKEDQRREITQKYKKLLERCEEGKDPQLFFTAADQAVALKNYDQALVLLDKALELYPKHPVALRKKAEIKLTRSEKKIARPNRPTRPYNNPPPNPAPRAPAPPPRAPAPRDELADNFEDAAPPRSFRQQMTEQIQAPTNDSAEKTFAFTEEELDQGSRAGSRPELEDFSNKSMEWTDEDLRQGHHAGTSSKPFDPDETSAQAASYAPAGGQTDDYQDYDDYDDYGDYDDYDADPNGAQNNNGHDDVAFNTDRDAPPHGGHQASVMSAGFQSEINKTPAALAPERNIIDKFGFEPTQPSPTGMPSGPSGERPALFSENRPVERGLPQKDPSAVAAKVSNRASEFQQMMQEQADHSYAAHQAAPVVPQAGGGVFELVDDVPESNTQLEKASRRKSTKKQPITGQPFGDPIPAAHEQVSKATKENDPPWANEFAEPEIPKFSLKLGQALTFPFSPIGIVGIVFGGILLGGLSMVGGMAYFFIGLLPYFYVYAYYSRIINTAAKGRTDLPDWPDISETGNGVRIIAVDVICKLGTILIFALIFYFQGANTAKATGKAAKSAFQNRLNGENVSALVFQDSSQSDSPLTLYAGSKTILALWSPPRRFNFNGGVEEDLDVSLSEDDGYLLLSKVAEQYPELRFACALRDPEMVVDTSDTGSSINLIYTKEKKFPGVLGFANTGGVSYVFLDESGEVQKLISYQNLMSYETGGVDELKFLNLCKDFKEGKLETGGTSIFSMLNSGLQIILFVVAMLFTLAFVIIYYPVAAMMASLLGTWTIVFNVPAVLRTMFLMKRDYFLKFVPFWFLIIGISYLVEPLIKFSFGSMVQAALGNGAAHFFIMFLFTTFLSWAVYIYGLMATGNVLGRLYYHNQREIDWF